MFVYICGDMITSVWSISNVSYNLYEYVRIKKRVNHADMMEAVQNILPVCICLCVMLLLCGLLYICNKRFVDNSLSSSRFTCFYECVTV